MSESSQESVTCPGCRTQLGCTMWRSVNACLNPELKVRVLDGSLFRIVCKRCRAEITLNYDLYYHEPDQKVMIYYREGYDGPSPTPLGANDDPLAAMGYRFRIVDSLQALQERIRVIDHNYSDIDMEIFKALTVGSMSNAGETRVAGPLFFSRCGRDGSMSFHHSGTMKEDLSTSLGGTSLTTVCRGALGTPSYDRVIQFYESPGWHVVSDVTLMQALS